MKRSLFTIVVLSILALAGCGPRKSSPPPQLGLDQIADSYVKQVLALGEHDPDYVLAYYGPAEWRTQEKTAKRSLLNIRNVIARLYSDADTAPVDADVPPELWEQRKRYLRNQLGALDARVRMLQDWKPGFDDESLALYDVSAPFYGREDFTPMLEALDQLLPKGPGTVGERYQRYLDRYTVPKDKIEAVMQAAIEVARQRSFRHFRLPAEERFELALVSGKPWSDDTRYQGKFVSRLEINTDRPLRLNRAMFLASHEGYPGHHLANAMIEDQLVRSRNWREFTVITQRSPATFIAEGSAGYGQKLAFPQDARLALLRYLFGLCGYDASEVEHYDAVIQAAKPSEKAMVEAARRYRDGQASADETLEWLQSYALVTPDQVKERLASFDRMGAHLINDVYGEEVIQGYIDRSVDASEPERIRWRMLFDVLTQPRTPHSLLPEA